MGRDGRGPAGRAQGRSGKVALMTTPAAVLAQRQLDAYNAHDLDAFLACYTDDVEVHDVRAGTVLLRGREAMRERYAPVLAQAGRHAALVSRATVGRDVAIDLESVTTAAKPEPVE